MQVKVFCKNEKTGKIEFTQEELEKLLNSIYYDGYNEGKKYSYTWTSPSITNYPITYTTSTGTTTNAVQIKCESNANMGDCLND